MSRCKCCDTKLDGRFRPVINPHTGREDDLCGKCRSAAGEDRELHEYTQGEYPKTGLTLSVEAPYE